MQKKRQPKYTEEFRQRAVELSVKRSVAAVAKELDISPSSLVRWRAEAGHSEARVSDEMTARQMKGMLAEQQRRIAELEKENKIAEMERDILKKRRPSSRGIASEISLYPSGEGQLPVVAALSRSSGLETRVLFLAVSR